MVSSSSSSGSSSGRGGMAAVVATAAVATTTALWYYTTQQYSHQRRRTTTRRQSYEKENDDATKAVVESKQQEEQSYKRDININNSKDEMGEGEAAGVARSVLTESTVPLREIDTTNDASAAASEKERILTKGLITIVHGSMTGTCAAFSQQVLDHIKERVLQQQASNLSAGEDKPQRPGQPRRLQQQQQWRDVQLGTTEDWDWWDELLNDDDVSSEKNAKSSSGRSKGAVPLLVLLLPTYTGGSWPPVAEQLENALKELQTDWRITKFPLKNKLKVAIFGMGSSEYTQYLQEEEDDDDNQEQGDNTGPNVVVSRNMGQPAREAASRFSKLGAKIITKLRVGDDAVGDHANETFALWLQDLENALLPPQQRQKQQQRQQQQNAGASKSKQNITKGGSKNNKTSCDCKESGDATQNEEEGCCKTSDDHEHEHDNENYDDFDEDDDDDDEDDNAEPEIMDLEDMGDVILASSKTSDQQPREMVTSSQAKALKKEGYKLIGTHSAVKLCRWTKHQLRGRGGCYKHTFYGITSYQCMEATPSLACANKCVFCWRHHKNPVGKEWRWKTDDPQFIVEQAVETHVRMIKEAKGIPGVRMDRWKEAHTVRHCALSLVGEPIMYPRIDELLGELHHRKISTFLVTNGQHPQAIESIRPITQLYVSVDAPNRDSLIEIDRPLFQDAWERLKESLVSLKSKGQRTVARLTVVKGWNSDDVEGYANLIALGQVSLVEVKGVTFCGKSDASNLNMTNTPWHHEVVELTRSLKQEIDKIRLSRLNKDAQDVPPEYDLACEHKHSCSVLLARVDQFKLIDPSTGQRKWHTWINYEKFQELAARNSKDPSFSFSITDYTAETPSWALYGAEEEGFDPTDTRHRKAKKHPMYTRFDEDGIPTHDHNDQELSAKERQRLSQLMEERKRQIGSAGSTVTELRGGAKEIQDASLMFRGLVVSK